MSKEFDNFASFWSGKRVLITGHTGFKGGWLSSMLALMGAEVKGYSLPPPTTPSFYQQVSVSSVVSDERINDILNTDALAEYVSSMSPEIVFHLAAQPIVRESYDKPAYSFNVNAMGSLNLLEACRNIPSIKAIVVVTTDKCYKNANKRESFCEDDKLGGHDPYSASKACAEIIVESYRESFFNNVRSPGLATARAGNVVGGGDWAMDRLLPDYFRAVQSNKDFVVRNPEHVRPWQHVLDCLNGYIVLAEKLWFQPREFSEAWNFGPMPGDFKSVSDVVSHVASCWNGRCPSVSYADKKESAQKIEASYLALDISKSVARLGWRPKWSAETAVEKTVLWYKGFFSGASPVELVGSQLNEFYET